MNKDEIEIYHDDHAVELRMWEDLEGDNGKVVRATKELFGSDSIEGERTFTSTPGEESTSGEQGARPNEKKKRCLTRRFLSCSSILVIIVGSVIAFVTLWQTGFLSHEENLTSSVSSSTGDSKLPLCNGLASNCGWRVNEIMFAGVHNAMSSKDDGFVPWNNLSPLEDALNAGFRALFIDSCNCGVFGVALCHGVCAAGYRKVIPVFTAILNFLSRNSNEVVILELQIGKDSFVELMNTVFEIPGFADALYEHPGRGLKWPLMMDLINNNKRLIIFQHDGGGCDTGLCPKGVHDTYVHAFETPFNSMGVDGLMNVTSTCQITRGDYRNAFFISNHFAGDKLLLPDYDIAMEANSAQNLETRLDACEKIVGKRVNILVVDFWDIGDVLQVVSAYNQELGFASAMPSMAPSLEPTTTRAPTMLPSASSRPSEFYASKVPSESPKSSPIGQSSVPLGSPMESVSPFGQLLEPPSSTPLETTSSTVPSSTKTNTWSPVEAIPSMSSASSLAPVLTTSQTAITIEPSPPSNSPSSIAPPTNQSVPFSQSNIFVLPTQAPSLPFSLGSNEDYVSSPPSQFGLPILTPTTIPITTTMTPSLASSPLHPTIISTTSDMPLAMTESWVNPDAPSPDADLLDFNFNFVDLNP